MTEAMELVVLLHGIGRTGLSMGAMARHLRRAGYETLSPTYASLRKPLAELADDVDDMLRLSPVFHTASRVHFVTHSMGGLVTRHYLHKHHDTLGARMGRVVMLGPPNRGSALADMYGRLPLYHKLFGPAGAQLAEARHDSHLPDECCRFEFGVIAGTRGWLYPDGQLLLQHPHDGRVTVENTKHTAMTAHMTVPVAHGFMMSDKRVMAATVGFLRDGVFPG